MNANTALRPDPRLWNDKAWPEEIIKDKELLEQSFQHAVDMLQPTPYPKDWPVLPKLATLEAQAKGAGAHDKFVRPPITVHFKDALNPAGVYQKASTLTGNDTTGINDWSKNTTLLNYIPDAWNHGAEIYTCCNVVRVEKAKKGSHQPGPYVVYFEWQDDSRAVFLHEHGANIAPMFITADIVVLGAGALGTTEILLRSAKCGLKTSDQIGKHFSGNGDVSNKMCLHCGKKIMSWRSPYIVPGFIFEPCKRTWVALVLVEGKGMKGSLRSNPLAKNIALALSALSACDYDYR